MSVRIILIPTISQSTLRVLKMENMYLATLMDYQEGGANTKRFTLLVILREARPFVIFNICLR